MKSKTTESGQVVLASCLDFLPTLEANSVDLVFGSPPYEDVRTYGIDFCLKGQAWVDWMVEVVRASLRVCRGAACFVVEGKTEDFNYTATPFMLVADLKPAGITLRKPKLYKRNGIMGSGGPDDFRNDYELIVVATNGGKLPWSDNLACGKPPVCKPGGKPTNRNKQGERATQSKPVDVKIANPGNVIDCGAVGGGNMGGDYYTAQNEAPFPEHLAEFFVRSWCPPGGIVLDPFCGSGTTSAVAVRHGRRYLTCDVRASQCKLAF